MDLKKLNHKIYSKLRKDGAKLWSFSVVSSYENCPHEYYLKRILKFKGVDNIYTQSGTLSHDILETHYMDGMCKNVMRERFNKGMLEIFTNGYRFGSEKIERGYMDNMRLYFDCFTTDPNIIKCEEFVSMPLWVWDSSLIDEYMQGWADAILIKDGEISIGDFKSSTIFKGKDLLSKSKQLILYAVAYEYLYKKKVKSVFFDFLKYCEVTYIDSKGKEKTKIIERREIHTVDNIVKTSKAYVFVDLTDEIKSETIKWFIDTINKIKQDEVYEKGETCGNNSYFCKNLCGYAHNCQHVFVKK